MFKLSVIICVTGLLSSMMLTSMGSPSRQSGSSAFSNIYSAISSALSKKFSTFSDTLLPSDDELELERRDISENIEYRTPNPGFYDKLSVAMDRSGFQAPTHHEVITQASLGPRKRSPQLSFPDNTHFKANKGSSRDSMDIIFPSELAEHNLIENHKRDTNRIKGKLVLSKDLNEMTRSEAIQALNSLLDSPMGSKLLEKAARQAAMKQLRQEEVEFQLSESGISSRAAGAGNTRTVTASPIILSSTEGPIRLIQPIQFISSPKPRNFPSPTPRNFPSPTPKRLSSPNRQKTSSFNSLVSSNRQQKPRLGKQQPALTFVDNGLVAVLGRQVAGKPVEGFPNGLPALTPLGVRLTIENMLGPDGELIMNPIPGEAGTDYPVYNSVPDTGFSCNQQDYPGIFTDVASDCQAFYMCQPNGESTAFLCPNGTMFNQQYFVCDWWYNLDCAQQPNFYNLNVLVYDTPENEGKKCTSLFCQDD